MLHLRSWCALSAVFWAMPTLAYADLFFQYNPDKLEVSENKISDALAELYYDNSNNGHTKDVSFFSNSSFFKGIQSIKLAYVDFIVGKNNPPKFTQRCYGGWELIDGECKPKPCDGYPYDYKGQQQKMCKKFETCMSGDSLKVACTECRDNLVPDENGGCKCPDKYGYTEELCWDDGATIDATKETCSVINASGPDTVYYQGCLCNDFKSCKAHGLLGDDSYDTCKSYGTTFYKYCKCEAKYTFLCNNAYEDPVGEPCINEGTPWYENCDFCNVSLGLVYRPNEYWCENPWVNIKPMQEYYEQN